MQQRIGPYELLERLGSGGMGAVYRARRDDTGQVVALKVMREDLAEDSSFMKRFAREATIARSVDSPNIVRVIDVGQEGYLPYIAMELVDGESLASLMRKTGALTVDLAVDIAAQVAQGLHDAQKAGIIHRDISPQNVLITHDGTAKIADFGIARSQTTATLTSAGSFVGKPTYAPPEMLEGRADTRSDIYSLGVVMFEMLSGRPPFIAPTPLATMDMHARQEPPRLSLLGVRTPPRLDEIIRKCLAKDPGDRFQTPAELLRALRNLSQAEADATIVVSTPVSEATRILDADVTIAEGAGRGRTPPPAPPRGSEGPRRWPVALAITALGAVTFAAAAGITWTITRGTTDSASPPEPVNPAAGAVLAQPRPDGCVEPGATWVFEWMPLEGRNVAGYDLLVARGDNPPLIEISTADTSYTHSVACSDPISEQSLTGWWWQVRSQTEDGAAGDWSDRRSFSVEPQPTAAPTPSPPPAPAAPALAAPPADATAPQHVLGRCPGPDVEWVFSWQPDPSGQIASYDIVVERAPEAPVVHTSTSDTSYTHKIPCAALIADENLSGWTWRVRGNSVNGETGQWSASRAFNVSSRNPCGANTPCQVLVRDRKLGDCTLFLRPQPARGPTTDPCLAPGTMASVNGQPTVNDGYVWWPVIVLTGSHANRAGWVAEGDTKNPYIEYAPFGPG